MIVSAVSAEESRLHGVAVRRRLGRVSCRGSVGGGGRSRVARRGVAVTGVGLLGGPWSSSRGGQHELLAWVHTTQEHTGDELLAATSSTEMCAGGLRPQDESKIVLFFCFKCKI